MTAIFFRNFSQNASKFQIYSFFIERNIIAKFINDSFGKLSITFDD